MTFGSPEPPGRSAALPPAAWAEAFLSDAPIGTIGEPARSRIVADVTQTLQPLAGEDGFAFPISAHIPTETRVGA